MALFIENKGGSSSSTERFTVPEGVHVGILVRIIDLGIQEQRPYKGEERPDVPQVQLVFELPHELVGDKPAFVSKTVKRSAHPKSTLFKIVSALMGGGSSVEKTLEKGLPLDKVLGKGAQVQVSHFDVDGNTIAFVASVLPVVKGMSVPGPVSELLVFDLANPDSSVMAKLSPMTQDKIAKSKSLTTVKKTDTVKPTIIDEDEF